MPAVPSPELSDELTASHLMPTSQPCHPTRGSSLPWALFLTLAYQMAVMLFARDKNVCLPRCPVPASSFATIAKNEGAANLELQSYSRLALSVRKQSRRGRGSGDETRLPCGHGLCAPPHVRAGSSHLRWQRVVVLAGTWQQATLTQDGFESSFLAVDPQRARRSSTAKSSSLFSRLRSGRARWATSASRVCFSPPDGRIR